MKLFLDTEFTGLHQYTSLISLALIDENNRCFYAEFDDYDTTQVDDWIQDNVLSQLTHEHYITDTHTVISGNTNTIRTHLVEWLKYYDQAEIWSDTLAYDWVLFNQLFGHAFDIPDNIYYIPFDIATLFKIKNIDPDVDRTEFSGITGKHNALNDARMIQQCYWKLMKL